MQAAVPGSDVNLATVEALRLRFRRALAAAPVIALLKGIEAVDAAALLPVLRAAGMRLCAVPVDRPGAIAAIAALSAPTRQDVHAEDGSGALPASDPAGGPSEEGWMTGGAFVRHRPEVERVSSAGGRLVLMPHVDPPLITRAKTQARVVLVSCATPTEAFQAVDAGADGLLIYPATAIAPAMVPGMQAILPKAVPILAYGGISAEAMGPWRDVGVAGFVVGAALWRHGQPADETARRLDGLLQAALHA